MQVHGLASTCVRSTASARAEHAGDHPDECIDCTLCVPECPSSVLREDDVPDSQKEFIALNRERAQDMEPIIERKSPPPDADQWAKVKDKKKFLEK